MRKIVIAVGASVIGVIGIGALALGAQPQGVPLAQIQAEQQPGQVQDQPKQQSPTQDQKEPTAQDQKEPTAQDQKEPTAQDKGKMTQRGSGTLEGVVQGNDNKKGFLTVRVPVSRNAQITRDGQAAKVEDIQKGDDVRAAYDPITGSLIRLEAVSEQMQKQTGKNH